MCVTYVGRFEHVGAVHSCHDDVITLVQQDKKHITVVSGLLLTMFHPRTWDDALVYVDEIDALIEERLHSN